MANGDGNKSSNLTTMLGWLHVVLSLVGVALCGIHLEGPGVFILCISLFSLMVLKVDTLVAPSEQNEIVDLMDQLERCRTEANVIYRRAATLGSLVDARSNSTAQLGPKLAQILRQIDSTGDHVDIEIENLRGQSGDPGMR